MGLLYIKNWTPALIPILSLITGSISIFGFIYLGEKINTKFKIDIEKNWQILINLILGIFTFSLCIQLISIFRLNNKFTLTTLFILFIIFSIKKISMDLK